MEKCLCALLWSPSAASALSGSALLVAARPGLRGKLVPQNWVRALGLSVNLLLSGPFEVLLPCLVLAVNIKSQRGFGPP